MKNILAGFLLAGLGLNLWGAGSFVGEGRGSTELAAQSQGVEKALEGSFRVQNKDSLYQRLFMGDPGLEATLDVKVLESNQGFGGEWKVRVSVEILDTTGVDSRYAEAVASLLSDGEEEIAQGQQALKDAEKAVGAKNFSLAWTALQTSRSRLLTLRDLLASVTNEKIRSPQGQLKPVVQQKVDALVKLHEEALLVLKDAEKAELANQSQKDVFDTFTVLQERQSDLDRWIAARRKEAPFYGFSEAWLADTLVEVENRRVQAGTLEKSFRELESPGRNLSLLFSARLRQSITDLAVSLRTLEKIKQDLEKEKQDPRVLRLERERASRRYWDGVGASVGKTLGTLLTRPTEDHVALQMFLPFQVTEGTLEFADLLPLSARLEGRYAGIWLRTEFSWQARDLVGRSRSSVLAQEFSFGFGDPWIFGAGYAWDWYRYIPGHGGADRFQKFMIHWGLVDKELDWPLWMLDLWYELPPGTLTFDTALNLGLEGTLRFTRYFKLEGAVFSHVLPGPLGWEREVVWRGAAGFRLPFLSSLLWGLSYETIEARRLAAPQGAMAFGRWELYLDLSL